MEVKVIYNGVIAGYLKKENGKYFFQYDKSYLSTEYPAISLSFPKRSEEFISEILFPFFFGLLAEGDNKTIQCRNLKIDENDHFTRLAKTANENTIGAITIEEAEV